MKEMKYATIIDLISDKLKEADIPHVLIGGFAVNAYKITRQTADIDFLIIKADFSKISDLLKKEGYEEGKVSDICGQMIGKSPFYWDIDFVFVDKMTLEGIRQEGKKVTIAGREFLIPSVMHLLALKLHALKNNPEKRMAKDWEDVIALIEKENINVYSPEFKNLCLKYGKQELYDKILRDMGKGG